TQHLHPFLDREQSALVRVDAERKCHLVEQLRGPTQDVEMAVGERVEGSGVDGAAHGTPSFASLGLWFAGLYVAGTAKPGLPSLVLHLAGPPGDEPAPAGPPWRV